MMGMVSGAVCVKCHETGKFGAPLAGATVARTIRTGLDGLSQQIHHAEATLADAERLGMEVSEPKFELRGSVNALTNARTLIHSFRAPPVEAALAEGRSVAEQVQKQADHALEEYSYRRVWLAASLVPILIVIGMLVLYIRKLPPSEPAHTHVDPPRHAGDDLL
jgi:hypothetical protein